MLYRQKICTGIVVLAVGVSCVSAGSVNLNWADGLSGVFSLNESADIVGELENASSMRSWTVTLGNAGYLDRIGVWNTQVAGDSFVLFVNGMPQTWTTTRIDSEGKFHGESRWMYFPAGSDKVTLTLLSLPTESGGSGSQNGENGTGIDAHAEEIDDPLDYCSDCEDSFSSGLNGEIIDEDRTGAVGEPATITVSLMGIVGIAGYIRRRFG